LIRISASLAGRLLPKRKLPLRFNIDIHRIPLPLRRIVSIVTIRLVPFHYDLVFPTTLKHLLCSGHAHIFFTDIVVGPLEDISGLCFLQLLLLHLHFGSIIYIYVTTGVWLLAHAVHADGGGRIGVTVRRKLILLSVTDLLERRVLSETREAWEVVEFWWSIALHLAFWR
jgi:hypothetical protein